MAEEKSNYGFIGEYEHSVDDKNRVILPSVIRDKIDPGERLVITVGLDGCLTLYPYPAFESYVEQYTGNRGPTADVRKLRRHMLGRAKEVSIDGQGRLVLPKELKEDAGIVKTVTVVGNFDSVEIWNPDKWESYLSDVDLEDAAESVWQDGT